jgi:hypothetical protein
MKMIIDEKKTFGKTVITCLFIGLLLFQQVSVFALTSSEAKQVWYDAKEASREAKSAYREAQLEWATNKTEENKDRLIETGKASMLAALDEAEAWLLWRQAELDENPEIPEDLRGGITLDIEVNLAKVDNLRAEVNEVDTQLELAIVFLKMVGKYLELVSDVARNTGLVWVYAANSYADAIEDYENQMREAAGSVPDTEDVVTKLDTVVAELEEARTSINAAEQEYWDIATGDSPLLSFKNGNHQLRIARNHMINAQRSLREAYQLLVR